MRANSTLNYRMNNDFTVVFGAFDPPENFQPGTTLTFRPDSVTATPFARIVLSEDMLREMIAQLQNLLDAPHQVQ